MSINCLLEPIIGAVIMPLWSAMAVEFANKCRMSDNVEKVPVTLFASLRDNVAVVNVYVGRSNSMEIFQRSTEPNTN